MHFTVVLSGDEARDMSYGLVFIPCPVWVQGAKELVNCHPSDPAYKAGDFRRLLKAENISVRDLATNHCTLVAHPGGHGTPADRAEIVKDLEREGLVVNLLQPVSE